jgi:hypothetical protein
MAWRSIAGDGVNALASRNYGYLLRHFFRPQPRAVQHTKNADFLSYDLVCRDVRCAVNDQLARAFDTTGPATLGKLPQLLHMPLNAIVHDNCSSWTIRFDVVEDGFPVRQCEQ